MTWCFFPIHPSNFGLLGLLSDLSAFVLAARTRSEDNFIFFLLYFSLIKKMVLVCKIVKCSALHGGAWGAANGPPATL